MEMDSIHAPIRTVRLRLQAMKAGRWALSGSLAGLGAAAVLLGIARFVPVPNSLWWALGCMLLGAAAGAAAAYIRPVDAAEAAKAMDRADTSGERRDLMTTALEFSDRDSAAARWQRAQAEAYGREFAAARRDRLPFVWPARRFAGGAALLIALCALLLILPSPMDRELAQRQQEQAMIEAQRKKAETLAEQLKQAPIEPEAKAPLADSAAKLAKELGNSRRAEEALDKMENAMKELGRKADQSAQEQKALQDWGKKLAAQQSLKKAAEQSGDVPKSAEALKNAISKLSDQQKKDLANAMQNLAEQAPQSGKQTAALQDALKKAAEQLAASGQLSDKQIQDLAEKLAAAASESGALGEQSELAASAAAQIAKSGQQMAGELAAAGVSVSDTWGSGGSAEALAAAGEAAGSGGESSSGEGANGSSQSSGSGQGSGSQGSGSGSGQGSGQGSGSGSGSGQGSGSGSGSGSGAGQGGGAGWGSGGRELVTTPRDLQGSGNVQSDNGPSSGGGDKQKGGTSPTIDGVSRPYDEVYGEYSQRAKDSLGRSDLPQSVQGLVESYFTEIRPGS